MGNNTSSRRVFRRYLLLLPALTAVALAQAQALSGTALLAQLRLGGDVIVMRHASSPRTAPDSAHANADNIQNERQLDDVGRAAARSMGAALHQLQIPVGQVLSSPTYRALETVRLAQFGVPRTFPQLGDSGQSMQADPSGARGAWLRAQAATPPPAGTNTIIVTHFPNMTEAFAQTTAGLTDGEAMVFHPNGRGAASFVARVKIDEWTRLGAAP
jgi:phosphohistidine phosphatase SixA